MIYYLTKYAGGKEVEPVPAPTKKAKSFARGAPLENDDYLIFTIPRDIMTDQNGKPTPPSKGDVMIIGEDTYGIDAVGDAINSYEFLAHKLEKTRFGGHTFAIGAPE